MYDGYQRHIEVDLSLGKPKVDSNKCVACEECINICENDAIIISKKTGKAFIIQGKCVNGGSCIDICPMKCIKRRK